MTKPIAIVGCGRMGRIRALACRKSGFLSLILIDADATRSEALAAEIGGAQILADPGDLPWADLHALFVCVPPGARGSIEVTAIEHSVPFFIEKPVGISVDQMMPVARLLAERPVVHAVGYMNRYRQSVETVRQSLANERVVGFSARWVNGIYTVPWWSQAALSGGALNEQLTHFVDMVRYLLGNIVEVNAIVRPHRDNVDVAGAASVTLQIDSGPIGSIFYSCEADYKSMEFTIITKLNAFVLEGWDMAISRPAVADSLPLGDRNDIFVSETKAFLDAIDGNPSAVRCDLADALQTQAVSDAIARSVACGQSVRVQQIAPRLR